jgi:KaiC/GvpD/RAD55 family RecA-like ATPase
MADPHTIRQLINKAIKDQSTISIQYRDYHNNVSERSIVPYEWVGQSKIRAFCLLRDEERHFRVENIIDISQSSQPSNNLPLSSPATVHSKSTQDSTQPISVSPTNNTKHISQSKNYSFNKVKSSEDWNSLLEYYISCLNYEYQQKFSLFENSLEIIDLKEEEVFKFLSGKSNLVINVDFGQNKLKKFLDPSNKSNQQLCFGKSFIRFNDGIITPLLFVPVTINRNNPKSVILKPEELSLSYASFVKLDYSPEDIAVFLSSYQEFINSQPPLVEIEQFIKGFISKNIITAENKISINNFISEIPICNYLDVSGLFWVDNRFTGNLINELNELINYHGWNSVPTIVNNLFNHLPEHKHQPPPEFINDNNFYVTDINSQQRKSARAVTEHPVTIITGPPGTGKSQLVLNLIAQAFLDRKTVLFASHNNKAVDVVMDRLQDEIRFQGAIRTGNKTNRKKAVAQMENALAQIQRVDLKNLQKRYEEGKTDLRKSDHELIQIRDLKGKIHSYQNEREEVLSKIPDNWREEVASLTLAFNENEKNQINQFLSDTLAEFRYLNEQREKIIEQLRTGFDDEEAKYQALTALKDYELKWGEFAAGILHKASFSSLSELHAHCSKLIAILDSLSIKKEHLKVSRVLIGLRNQIDQNSEKLSDEQLDVTLRFSELKPEELERKQAQLAEFEEEIENIKNNNFSFFQKLLITLHIINPKKKLFQNFNLLVEEADLKDLSIRTNEQDINIVNKPFDTYQLIIQTSELLQRLDQHKNEETKLKSQLDKSLATIPDEIVKSFEKINLEQFSSSPLVEFIRSIQENVAANKNELDKTINKSLGFFIDNDENLHSIQLFKQLSKEGQKDGPFGLQKGLTEDQAFNWATTFRRALVVWEANTIISFSQDQLGNLPTEEQALAAYKTANNLLFNTAGDLMRATWFNRAGDVTNEVFEGTRQYISAVDQLNNLNYGQDASLYGALKDSERKNFTYAFQMFPIWAITNLTARTNFPLESGLFDLLIIDEASQCDIPSAIPLLYRAKKVVIIGDPNQLRHVASLDNDLDKTLGNKYQVGLEALSYVSTSLYDLGDRSVGLHPGPILLDEHYRSDPRIIDFSNKEFYGNKLKIKTDLTQRGFEKSFINQSGGIHWINIKGNYERPKSGRSAFNNVELQQLEVLVPKLLKTLDDEGYSRATLGIVTPFRAQENRIQDWLSRSYGINGRVISGTAHQFQGDESDVIIFSPVLSAGIAKGTLNWLESTYNLLNVAITRARVNLIIVGDFDYCYQELKSQSIYSHLAKYVKEQLNGIYSAIDELPILGGERFEILGTIIDPSNPEYNRTNLLRFIRSCKGYLDWVDSYFTQEIIDLFDDLYEQEPYPDIKTYRLLTAERQLKMSSGKLRPESVKSLQSFLEKFDVEFDLRVLPGEKLPHDRFLYHRDGSINMPPFSGAYGSHRHISEYTASFTKRELFNQHWEKAVSVVDVY